ncbi:putative nuclease HARBI1 [Copidosoma floridanum]|uniref:putative nuclease HARBI1 n=1 Tax=Copidosoma floridanum TaxID=29053 RepID=UPI000C6FBFFA|nr:putative nuclease HARBI1 [Copidosoma floridanum]
MAGIMLAAAAIFDVDDEVQERRRSTRAVYTFIRQVNNPLFMGDELFRRYYRMTPRVADLLVNLLAPYLNYHGQSIEPHHQVLAVVRFLAEGGYQKGVSADVHHPMSQSTFSIILHSVIPAIIMLSDQFIVFPRNPVERQIISQRFEEKIGFPGVLGALDCTLPKIHKPVEHEEAFLNHHQQHSLNISDTDYNILSMRIVNGSTHDQFVWDFSEVKEHMYSLRANLEIVDNEGRYYVIGDSGYTVSPILLTPLLNAAPNTPERRFSDALRGARCVVEQTFGIIKEIFRCLNKDRSLDYDPLFACEIVKACGVLYNFLRHNGIPMPIPPREIEDAYRGEQDQVNHEYVLGVQERQGIIDDYFY